jgi:hypothetical protein
VNIKEKVIIENLEELENRIRAQMIKVTPQTTEEEKRNIEIWNPILNSWLLKIDSIKNITKLIIMGNELYEEIEEYENEYYSMLHHQYP